MAMAGVDVPDKAIARNIADVVQVLVHIERINGVRRVSELLKIGRYDSTNDEYELTQM